MRCVIVGFLIAAYAGQAQQVGGNSADVATFSSKTQLVVETVTVADKKGNPVEGLTAGDFTISENGAPQVIRLFEQQKLPPASTALPLSPQPEKLHIYDKLGRTSISPEAPGGPRYKDRRLLVFYFDMTAMPPSDQLRALAAAEKFVRSKMTSADLIAILRYAGGSVDVLQDFSADRNRLLSILETMMVGEGQGLDESTNDAGSPDTGAAFGQDDSEFNIFNTDRQLSALQTAARILGQLSEKKSLLYFASGLRLNGLNNQAQLHATINEAVRAGVAFWPIDARGLVAEAPVGDATQASPGNGTLYSGAAALAVTTNLQQSQDKLYTLAADTGGKALLDTNDLSKGIVQAEETVSSYYILGYYTTDAAADGKFRRIKIGLRTGLAVNLDYRAGYFAVKQFSKFTAADKERQLEDALMLPDPITELTIAAEIDYFQLNRAEYFVPIVLKIPGRELSLAKIRGAQHTMIDFIGEIKDNYGSTVSNVRDKVNIKLNGETAGALAKLPVEYDTGFTLLPGKYVLKLLARDDETGRIGTYETPFVIPNLNKEVRSVAISSVVLSSERIQLGEALYSTKEKNKERAETVNPLVQGGEKLVPSVTRVFRRSHQLYVFLQAYQQQPAKPDPLIGFVGLYRGGAKVFETVPIKVQNAASNRLKTMSLRLDVPLNTVAAGDYECQVTILNPGGQQTAFWRGSVVIID